MDAKTTRDERERVGRSVGRNGRSVEHREEKKETTHRFAFEGGDINHGDQSLRYPSSLLRSCCEPPYESSSSLPPSPLDIAPASSTGPETICPVVRGGCMGPPRERPGSLRLRFLICREQGAVRMRAGGE